MSNTEELLNLTKNLNILYVEDDLVLRTQTTSLLECFFANVIVGEDGLQGLESFKSNKIDIIITDIHMPGLNGLEMVKEIKKIDDNVPVIVCSAFNEPKFLLECISLNIQEYLLKPLDFNKFKIVLKKIIDKNIIERKASLLNDYEKALMRSSVISKLDANGNFIFVNDKFCELTGYEEEDVLNKHFNLLRKKKSNKLTKLLKKIENTKEYWHGKLKNKTKSGENIWLNITINPIYGENRVIKEYLVIYNDITEEITLKKYLKKELNETKYNLKDALKLATQYEMAINESSILTKSNLKGEITFVNEKFCDISGYREDELLGKGHNIIRHPDMPKAAFRDLWDTIQKGECWQGIVKNRKKNGSSYWVSTTIIPIKNKKNKIKEYISIRHDLTRVFELHSEIEDTQRELVYKLGEVGETRSKETGNHVKRVAQYSKDLGLLYGLSKEECEILFAASPMHDIGKVGIPDEILKKPGKLTTEEFETMKTHAELGYRILKGSKRPVLQAAAIIAKEHHEKYDGSGYPNGLKQDEIHIYGRITALADVFDALGSDRYYKKAWEDERIFKLIQEERGKHFDPKLVDLFMNNLNKFLETRDKYSD